MNTDHDDSLDSLFAAEPDDVRQDEDDPAPWKIVIVDDEPAVHEVTRLALEGVRFGGHGLQFISCHSAAEGRQAMQAHPDAALVLLDVVMEEEHAGLDLARYIREVLGNRLVRIVLRTGQPGQAPERNVITDYDINDYKEKTELTAGKLFTLVYASLRAFRDLNTIEQSRRGLTTVIEASADIFKLSSLDRFARGVLEQMAGLMQTKPAALYMKAPASVDGFAVTFNDDRWRGIAGLGRYDQPSGIDIEDVLPPGHRELLAEARHCGGTLHRDRVLVTYFEDKLGNKNALLLDGVEPPDEIERDLVELFTRNVSIAFENIYLQKNLEETQQEIIYLLGEAVETRSQETGQHVKRVAEICRSLALACGLPALEADTVHAAAPLHDLGKIGIPDAILNKPGRHTDEERAIMQTHAEIGHRMLGHSRRKVLQAAAIIALEHHERWDGQGYPNRKQGEQIHLYGRISAIADVFDALLSERCYKRPWPIADVVALFNAERGKQFDPQLVDLFLARLDDMLAIRARFPDAS